MSARGFKPVAWVAAVGGAALGCYMVSLNVASERADVIKLERQIAAAKSDIRSLQTELGTRGRLSQLEQWNAEVLALSAPTTAQFVDSEVQLARFERKDPTIDEQAKVRLASADEAPAKAVAPSAPVKFAAAERDTQVALKVLHQAGLVVGANLKPIRAAAVAPPARAEALIGEDPDGQ
jgi:hypothetical protein